MSQNASVHGQNNIVVQIEGDRNQVNLKGLPYLTLTRYLARRVIDNDTDILSPYSLSIPLIGRDGDLVALRDWLRSLRSISVRVMTGPAGTGKTRLALELIEVMLGEDWDVGFVTSNELTRFFSAQNLHAWGWQRPTLIVVDYAALHAKAVHDWLAELSDHSGFEGKALRLLLLERSADVDTGWWRTAFGRADSTAKSIARLLDPAEPVTLLRIEDREQRRTIFQAALTKGRKGLSVPESGKNPHFDQQLDHLTWGGEPLFLMMAGLLCAKQGVSQVLALSRTDLAFDLAKQELERIGKAGGDNPSCRAILRHMAAYVTLCSGLKREVLERVIDEELHALRREQAGDAAGIADILIDMLPGPPDEAAQILPDMIGEAVCLLGLDDCRSDGAAAARRAFAHSAHNTVASVIRTAQDYAGQKIEEQTITAPLTWLDALIERDDINLDQLDMISDQLAEIVARYGASLALADHALRVIKAIIIRLEPFADQDDATRIELARNKGNLGIWLIALGRHEEALTATADAVEIFRELGVKKPLAILPEFASSLDNLGACLSLLGRRVEALNATEKTVAVYRKLAAANPDVFLPKLATSLNNLGAMLSALGRHDEALATAEETVAITRDLAAKKPDAFAHDLAMSLSNLSNALIGVFARPEEALKAAEEAVTIGRDLAAKKPDAFAHDLAMSLNSLSACLLELSRQDEALGAVREAEAIWHDLAAKKPGAFLASWAGSLHNLGNTLSNLGRWDEALDATTKAVAIRRDLATERPDAALPDLASSLDNLGGIFLEKGKWTEALEVTEEAIAVWGDLVAENEDAFLPHLATSLRNLGNRLGYAGQPEEALKAAVGAVAIHRKLVNEKPGVFLRDLAQSLRTKAACLEAVRLLPEACQSDHEAIATLSPAFLEKPYVFGDLMSKLMVQYFKRLLILGQEPDSELLNPIIEKVQTLANKRLHDLEKK